MTAAEPSPAEAPQVATGSGWRARLDLVIAALLFSTGGVCIKLLEGLDPLQRAGLRSLIAVLFLVLAWPQARRGYSWKALIFSFFYAGTLAFFVAANSLTTSANAIFLQSTAPLYVLLLSPIFLHELVRRADLLYMVALAVGLVLCFGSELFGTGAATVVTAPNPRFGNWCGVASGVLWACTIVGLRWFGKRAGAGEAGAGASVVLGNLTCFFLCLLIATFGVRIGPSEIGGRGFFAGLEVLDAKHLGVLAFLGVFQVGLAYIFITRGMARVPAMQASLLLLVEPVFNPVWSFLVLDERPDPWSLTGGFVILTATVLHGWLAPRDPAH